MAPNGKAWGWLVFGASLLSCGGFSACGGDAEGAAIQPRVGTLLVPLEASSPSGARYRLTNAELVLSGSEERTLELEGSGPSQATLAVGPYSATLQNGWSLLRLSGLNADPIAAELRSRNPARVEIEEDETTSLTLRFRVAGNEDVSLGENPPIEMPSTTPDAGGSGLDTPEMPEFPGGTGGNGTGGNGTGAGGGGSNTGEDAGTPSDAGTPPGNTCTAPEARCVDDVLEQLTGAAELPLCIPNSQQQVTTGITATVCGGGRQCSGGQAGCQILADASQSSANVRADGTLDVNAVANLSPTSVPVAIPPILIFGATTCNIGVSGSILTTAVAVPQVGADGLLSGFAITASQTNLDNVVLTLLTPGLPCSALNPTLATLRTSLQPQVDAAVRSSLERTLDGLATTLACQRCDTACAVSCATR